MFTLLLALVVLLLAARWLFPAEERGRLPPDRGRADGEMLRLREEMERLSAEVERLSEEQGFLLRLLAERDSPPRLAPPPAEEDGEDPTP